jgi:Zn-dependent protease
MGDMQMTVLRFVALLPALVVHEFAHGYSAYRFGDPTPKMDGRLTLNPLAHLDPIGTLMILFGPIGWAKPVRVNPSNFRNPGRDLMISTACGPLSNIIQGTLWALILRAVIGFGGVQAVPGNMFVAFLAMVAFINFVLAVFNLIPLGPLDGHEVLPYFLPYDLKVRYHAFNRQYGTAILFGLILASFVVDLPILHCAIIVPARFACGHIAGADPFAVLFMALR